MPVLGPKGLEVNCQADSTPPIHLCSLPLQFRYSDLWCSRGVGCRYVKIEGKLIALQVVDIPAFA